MNTKSDEATGARRMYPPVWFGLAILLMFLLDRFAPGPRWLEGPLRIAGALPFLFGLGLGIGGSAIFQRAGTTIKPFQESSKLVTNGPFRYARNPMYLGMALGLAGIGIFLGTLTPLLLIPAYVWKITMGFIQHEEVMLESVFGDAYREYMGRVRRWI